MTLPTYSTGTASVAAGGTIVTGSGGLWSGTNVKQGDFISIGGSAAALITEVTDTTHLKIAPWPGAAQTNAAYIIYQNYVGRVVGVAAAEDVGDMMERLKDQAPIYNVPTDETAPDPSYGSDGQWAYQVSTSKWWVKSGGVWVEDTGPTSGISQVDADARYVNVTGDAMGGSLSINNPADGTGLTIGGNVTPSLIFSPSSGATAATTFYQNANSFVMSAGYNALAIDLVNKAWTFDAQGAFTGSWIGVGTGLTTGRIYFGNTFLKFLEWNSAIWRFDGGAVHVADTTPSTSTTTGALTVAGGVGIGNKLRVQDAFSFAPSNASVINSAIMTVGAYGGGILMDDTSGRYHGMWTWGGDKLSISAGGTAAGFSTHIGQFQIDQGLGQCQVNFTTGSTSPTSGALTVAGGVGIGGDLTVGSQIVAGSDTASKINYFKGSASGINGGVALFLQNGGTTNFAFGNYSSIYGGAYDDTSTIYSVAPGGLKISAASYNFISNATFNVVGLARFSSTAASTSPTTGALTVAGGLGVAGALNVAGGMKVNGVPTANPYAIVLRAGTDLNLNIIADGTSIGLYGTNDAVSATAPIKIVAPIASTGYTSGALVVSGGVGVGGAVYCAADISTVASFGTTNSVSVANGGSSPEIVSQRGAVIVSENTTFGDCAMYVFGQGLAVMVGAAATMWVAPTTTPPAGKASFAYSGGQYKVFNNTGVTANFAILQFKCV